jgi:hypothetical protein
MRCAFVLFALTVTACSTGRGSGDSPADPPATTTARASGNEIATIVTHDAKVRILGSHDGALRVAVYRTDGVLAYDGISLDELRAADPVLHALVTSAVASKPGPGTTYVDAILERPMSKP